MVGKKKVLVKFKKTMGLPIAKCCRPGLHLCQWGRAGWNTLHTWAHTSPEMMDESERDDMRTLLTLFAKHIPCVSCREHFTKYLANHLTDASLSTRASLVRLLHDAHNSVNARTGKRVWTLREHYSVYRADDPAEHAHRHASVAIAALAVVASLALACRCRQEQRVR